MSLSHPPSLLSTISPADASGPSSSNMVGAVSSGASPFPRSSVGPYILAGRQSSPQLFRGANSSIARQLTLRRDKINELTRQLGESSDYGVTSSFTNAPREKRSSSCVVRGECVTPHLQVPANLPNKEAHLDSSGLNSEAAARNHRTEGITTLAGDVQRLADELELELTKLHEDRGRCHAEAEVASDRCAEGRQRLIDERSAIERELTQERSFHEEMVSRLAATAPEPQIDPSTGFSSQACAFFSQRELREVWEEEATVAESDCVEVSCRRTYMFQELTSELDFHQRQAEKQAEHAVAYGRQHVEQAQLALVEAQQQKDLQASTGAEFRSLKGQLAQVLANLAENRARSEAVEHDSLQALLQTSNLKYAILAEDRFRHELESKIATTAEHINAGCRQVCIELQELDFETKGAASEFAFWETRVGELGGVRRQEEASHSKELRRLTEEVQTHEAESAELWIRADRTRSTGRRSVESVLSVECGGACGLYPPAERQAGDDAALTVERLRQLNRRAEELHPEVAALRRHLAAGGGGAPRQASPVAAQEARALAISEVTEERCCLVGLEEHAQRFQEAAEHRARHSSGDSVDAVLGWSGAQVPHAAPREGIHLQHDRVHASRGPTTGCSLVRRMPGTGEEPAGENESPGGGGPAATGASSSQDTAHFNE